MRGYDFAHVVKRAIHLPKFISGLSLLTALSIVWICSVWAADCQSLWVERNAIYREHGLCFKSQREIRYFGNAGCTVDNPGALKLTTEERARIAHLKAIERSLGCGE
jgi:hypothetical protein